MDYFYLLPFIFTNAQSNMTIVWQVCYGGSEYDNAGSIVKTENGYLVLGTTESNDGDISEIINSGATSLWEDVNQPGMCQYHGYRWDKDD